jgi:hypothetical protein
MTIHLGRLPLSSQTNQPSLKTSCSKIFKLDEGNPFFKYGFLIAVLDYLRANLLRLEKFIDYGFPNSENRNELIARGHFTEFEI